MKWSVSPVIVDDHFIFIRGLCGYIWVNIFTLSSPRVGILVLITSMAYTVAVLASVYSHKHPTQITNVSHQQPLLTPLRHSLQQNPISPICNCGL